MNSTISSHITIRELSSDDENWVDRIVRNAWASEIVVSKGKIYHPSQLPGFVAEFKGKKAGLITYSVNGNACEIVTLNSFNPGYGIGSKLIECVMDKARQVPCQKVSLITTNDNTHALSFYKKRGFKIVAIHKNAVRESRKLKPEIPLYGHGGIEIKDEIELEYSL